MKLPTKPIREETDSLRDEVSLRWVDPLEVEYTWRPADFALVPESLSSDGVTARYSRLGDFVEYVGRNPRQRLPPAFWALRPSGDSIEFMPARGAGLTSSIRLPPEAIVIGSFADGNAPVAYWSDEYFPGGGVASSGIHVLRLLVGKSGAWLADELGSELCQRQIRANANEFGIGVLALLGIQVRLPPVQELEARARSVMETARRQSAFLRSVNNQNLARRALKPVLLTGASFEDRLTQFEEYLLCEQPVAREDMFFVEALTKDPNADLFTVRSLDIKASGDTRRQGLIPQSNRAADADWRRWYWRADAGAHTLVFDSLVGEGDLPANIILSTTGSTAQLPESLLPGSVLPTFRFLRDVAESVRGDSSAVPTQISDEAAQAWARFQQTGRRNRTLRKWQAEGSPGAEQSNLNVNESEYHSGILSGVILLQWLRQVFRPALALKVLRDAQVAGVYLLFGPDQLDHPNDVRALLDGYGARLSEILLQPSGMLEDAARRESLRRLSWAMHQLNGPLGRMRSILDDLQSYLARHPEVSRDLVPDEEKARQRASMPGQNIDRFTFAARLNAMASAAEEMRTISYQVRRLKRAQEKVPVSPCNLLRLLEPVSQKCTEKLPALHMTIDCDDQIGAMGNPDTLREALEEVLNNACRELEEHANPSPELSIRVSVDGKRVRLSIRDNALPITKQLLATPFEEGASTYASRGRGSGLGLTIVREIFRALQGTCDLAENRDGHQERVPGVTFEATLPLAQSDGR